MKGRGEIGVAENSRGNSKLAHREYHGLIYYIKNKMLPIKNRIQQS